MVATISGASFTAAFFVVFTLSERYSRRRARGARELEKFRLETPGELSAPVVNVRPGNVLVAVRNPNQLDHLRKVLEKTDTRRMDIVALAIRQVTHAAAGEHGLTAEQIFAGPETELFTRVVGLAEKAGKHVELLVVPGLNPYEAIVRTAYGLLSSRIVMGASPKLSPAEQGKTVGEQWERLPEPRPALSLEVFIPGEEGSRFFNLGPHPPRLWPEDLDLLHRLWLELGEMGPGARLHHRDVVGAALHRLERELHSGKRQEVLADVVGEISTERARETARLPAPTEHLYDGS